MSLKSDPDKHREWQRRSQEKARKKARTTPRTPIPPVNKERAAAKFERNFGDKSDWIRAQKCEVTQYRGEGIDAAHAVRRGAGGVKGSKLDLIPMRWDVHFSYDNDKDEVFLEKWGRTKDDVKAAAPWYEARWQAEKLEWLDSQGGLDF